MSKVGERELLGSVSRADAYRKAVDLLTEGMRKEGMIALKALAEDPSSPLAAKASMRLAELHREAHDFAEAELLLRGRCIALLSEKRRERIARIYLDLARAAARVDEEDHGLSAGADWPKALRLLDALCKLEMPRSLRDEAYAERASLAFDAESWNEALRHWGAYLEEFDPDYRRNILGRAHDQSETRPAGTHRSAARLSLVEAALRAHGAWPDFGDPSASMGNASELDDALLVMLDSTQALLEENAFALEERDRLSKLRHLHFCLPLAAGLAGPYSTEGLASASPSSCRRAVALSRSYRLEHGEQGYRQAMALAFLEASALARAGFDEEALDSLKKLAEGGVVPPATKAERELEGILRGEARFAMADHHQRAGRPREAQESFEAYLSAHPDGKHWQASQGGVYRSMAARGAQAVAEKDFELGRQIWTELASRRGLAPEGAWTVLATACLHEAEARTWDEADKPGKAKAARRKAIDEYAAVARRFAGACASIAHELRAELLRRHFDDLEGAVAAYRASGSPRSNAALSELAAVELRLVSPRVYGSKEDPKVEIEGRNLKSLRFRRYAIDLVDFFERYGTAEGIARLDLDLVSPEESWEVVPKELRPFREQRQSESLRARGPGAWAVTVEAEGHVATVLVLSSDLDLLLASTRDEVVALLRRENGREGVARGTLRIRGGQGSGRSLEVESDGQGIARAAFRESMDAAPRALATWKDHVAVAGMELPSGATLRLEPRGYLHCPRPIYRPGERVDCMAWIRTEVTAMEGVSSKEAREAGDLYELRLYGPDGRCLFERQEKLGPFGSFVADFDLPESCSLGAHRITATHRTRSDWSFSTSFDVQWVEPGKIELTVSCEPPAALPGDEIEISIHGAYTTGAPLAHRPVDLRLPDGRVLRLESDAFGNCSHRLDSRPYFRRMALDFHASVPGEAIQARGICPLLPAAVDCRLGLPSGPYRVGESLVLDLRTLKPDGTARADTELSVRIRGLAPRLALPVPSSVLDQADLGSAVEGGTESALVLDERGRSDGEGRWQLPFLIDGAGPAQITVIARDDQGRERSFHREIEVEAAISPSLRIEVADPSLSIGDDCSLTLHCEEDGRLGLVVFTSDRIQSAHVHSFAKGASDFTFPVTSELAPDCRLVALATGSRCLHRAEQAFTVRRRLRLAIEAPEDPVAPGEPIALSLRVRDENDRPVRAELSLALVDQALLALHPDRCPNLVSFFAEGLHRSVDLAACSSTLFRRVGEKKAIDAALLAEEKRLQIENLAMEKKDGRKGRIGGVAAKRMRRAMAPPPPPPKASKGGLCRDIAVDGLMFGASADMESDDFFGAEGKICEEVCCEAPCPSCQPAGAGGRGEAPAEAPREEEAIGAVWMAPVITDELGEARVELPAPRRCSTYRLRSRAMSSETLVADEECEIMVRKDVFLDLNVPARVMEGDRFQPRLLVHCATAFEGQAELRLSLRCPSREASHRFSTTLSGPGVYPIDGPDHLVSPQGPLVLEGELLLEGKSVDRLRRNVEVQPWGTQCIDGASGSAEGDVELHLHLPERVRPETARLRLEFAPRDEELLLRALDRGSYFAGGLTAPAARALALVELLAVPASSEERAKRRELARKDARRCLTVLMSSQQGDGSWPWLVPLPGKALPGDGATSAWAVCALSAGLRLGLLHDPLPRDRGLAYLRSTVGSLEGDALACVNHALAMAGSGDPVALESLAKKHGDFSLEGHALLALALLRLKRRDGAESLLSLLCEGMEPAADGNPERPWGRKGRASLRARALALQAIEALDGAPRKVPGWRRELEGELASPWNFSSDRAFLLWSLIVHRSPAPSGKAAYELTISLGERRLRSWTPRHDEDSLELTLHGEELSRLDDVELRVAYQGRGSYAWRATLEAFSPEIEEARGLASWGLEAERSYASPRLYQGRALAPSAMVVDEVALDDHVELELFTSTRLSSHVGIEAGPYLLLTRWLPAGCRLDETSLPSDLIWWRLDRNRLDCLYAGRPASGQRLRLMPTCPGRYRCLPTEASPTWAPGRGDRLGQERILEILGSGQKSDRAYEWSSSEHLAWGMAFFEDGRNDQALEHLECLSEELRDHRREVVRALLWIRCLPEHLDGQKVVGLFENLSRRWPKVVLPYEKLIAIGEAYRSLGRHEAACALWRATMASSWRDDLPVAAELEEAGEFLRAFAYVEDLFWEYPDLPIVSEGFFCLAQDMLAQRERACEVPGAVPQDLVERAVHRLEDFLHYFGELPYAPEAWLALLGALRDLEAHETCLDRARAAVDAWPDHGLTDRYRFFGALAAFCLQRYEEAVASCRAVAESEGPDAETATFLLAQMHHALGQPKEALEAYRKVSDDFDDARLAMDYLERRRLDLPELRLTRPGVPARIELSYVNVSQVRLQAYRVDLMRLFLKERNLEGIAEVETAGLKPTCAFERDLPPVAAGRTGRSILELPLEAQGAYLVLVRGEGAFASGLVLVSPLAMELQCFQEAVRVTVLEEKDDRPVRDVHVKVSDGTEFRSGTTDLRGSITLPLDTEEGVTVVARRGDSDYAFFRKRASESAGDNEPSVDWDEVNAVSYGEALEGTVRDIASQASSRLRSFYARRSPADRGVAAGATLQGD